MILLFSSTNSFRLFLSSRLVPEASTAAPLEFATHHDGRIWVKCACEFTKQQQQQLKSFQAAVRKTTRGAETKLQSVVDWPQILPLEKITNSSIVDNNLSDRTPVLFELPESLELADVAAEMLRLGNDRQSYRQHQTSIGTRTLLLVQGPPYYTLLRAIDRLDGDHSPRAYSEQRPGVWVEVGYRHPLIDHIQPPQGSFLLLSSPNKWQTVSEGPFHDIYTAVTFTVPSKPHVFEPKKLKNRFTIPLRLVSRGAEELAEFWVLNKSGVQQLEEIVRSADDGLISRLAFAVGSLPGDNDQQTVLVKIRPGPDPPPVLLLDGVACCRYLRIPHLYLALGSRLHPPLRRDAVTELLATNPQENTWLLPKPNGEFVPQSLPDSEFRPLSEWVDYILDSEHEPLAAWMDSMQFDFESFICPDDPQPPTAQPDHKGRKRKNLEPSAGSKSRIASKPKERGKKSKSSMKQQSKNVLSQVPSTEALKQELSELERQFCELSDPLHSPRREELWRALGRTYYALNIPSEGACCYINGVWEHDETSSDWIREWYLAQTQDEHFAPLSGEAWETALADHPAPLHINLLAIHLICAGFGGVANTAESQQQLHRAIYQLEKFDRYLPVQIAWLAWLGCANILADDVLALARTRDRLLERLYQFGLKPEQDLPGCLRSRFQGAEKRFRTIQDQLLGLSQTIQHWIREEFPNRGQTYAYADLILAYGYSRAGLDQQCYELAEATKLRLFDKQHTNPVHQWLFNAFFERISQSDQGLDRTTRLSPELMQKLSNDQLERTMVFAIDSFRSKSRILQPHEQVESQFRYIKKKRFELADEVDALTDIENPEELARLIEQLHQDHSWGKPISSSTPSETHQLTADAAITAKAHQVLLAGVLQFAPRLGELQAMKLLVEVVPTLETLKEVPQQIVLLERAFMASAHYGQTAFARQLVEHLRHLFETESQAETTAILGWMLSQSLGGFRKLGLREEILELLELIDRLVDQGKFAQPVQEPSKPKPKGKSKSIGYLKMTKEVRQKLDESSLKLNLAAGWFYFGNEARGLSLMNEVGKFLLQTSEIAPHLRRAVLCRYAHALAQAPHDYAWPKFQEIFSQLKKEHIHKGQAPGMQDQYYAFEPLVLIEAVVLALVSDDFTLDPSIRKLLDEHELSIRQRIHRDMQQVHQQAGHPAFDLANL